MDLRLHTLPRLALLAGLALMTSSPSAEAAAPVEPGAAPDNAGALPAAVSPQAEAALSRADLAAYRGWIKFLRFEAATAVARHGAASPEAAEKMRRLDEWLGRISADPNLLSSLQGVQEWAYESPVDGSGQPFKMAIPTDYNPSRPAPLSIYMHGYSGNHLEHATGMAAHPGSFDLSVLGRGRGCGYRALSEADVLDVIAYVQRHWAIDPNQIHLNGGSMGGGATYRLGSRYPDRWASGRPTCGFASHLPMGNLITFPIYATHSADDWTVSALHDRGPLARLREFGGQVIYDEAKGYGHAAWDYKEGNERGAAWEELQVRPDSHAIRRIDYTALDGGAVRGWWAEIVEWGAAPKPARFALTVGEHNVLFAELTNIIRLRVRVAESPFDRAQPLRVVVNGSLPQILPAPLPETVVLAMDGNGWRFESKTESPSFQLHTPGSALLLYQGDPLLIVYGTSGSEPERRAMRAAALAASKSPSPAWLDDSGDKGADGVPHSQNLYGWLNTKADAEVTDADLARCHVVLIGTAAQNSVVARLADRLPVRFASDAIVCDDGARFPGHHLALGLVHFNPLAPQRLIFWVASDDPATYAANSAIPQIMSGGDGTIPGGTFGADLLVMDASGPRLVATRSFDSRWHWSHARESSPLLPATLKNHRDCSQAIGEAIRRTAGADLAIIGSFDPPTNAPTTPGTTRVADVAAGFYYVPIGVCEMTGAEITEVGDLFKAAQGPPLLFCPSPSVKVAGLKPQRTYRVALPSDLLWQFSQTAKMAPRNYRHTDLQVADAVERFLVEE